MPIVATPTFQITVSPTGPQTLDLQVSASADDAQQDTDGNVDITATTVSVTATETFAGLRFTGLSGMAGATITSAVLTLNFTDAAVASPNALLITLASGDAPGPFVSGAGSDISTRPEITSGMQWQGTDLGTGPQQPPDLRVLVQELVNNNDPTVIVVILEWALTDGIEFTSWDGDPTNAAKLHIEYTPA